jgi:hypothetical protein
MVRRQFPPQDFFAEHFHVGGRFDPDADLASFDCHHPDGDVQARQDDGPVETASEDKHGKTPFLTAVSAEGDRHSPLRGPPVCEERVLYQIAGNDARENLYG